MADAVHVRRRLPRLPRQAPAPGQPRRESRRPVHRRFHRAGHREARPVVDKIRAGLTARQTAVAGRPLAEIAERLEFLLAVGLGYLTLDRSAATLSGGEAQRIRLATQIGSRLRGVLYVLDEPSIGLHPRDNGRLLASLEQLRDLGNTVLVVEHDEETIRRADYVVDLGPGAGTPAATSSPPARPPKSSPIPRPSPDATSPATIAIAVPAQRRAPNGKSAHRPRRRRAII